MGKKKRQQQQEETLFNLNYYTKQITPYDLGNADTDLEDVMPTTKNVAYTVGMKIGQVIEMENGKRGMVIGIIDGRFIRAYFPGEEPVKVCADDFTVVPGLRVQLGESCTLSHKESDLLRVQLGESCTLSNLAPTIANLSLLDLHQLKAMVEGLIEAMVEPEATSDTHRGYFEYKRINGYGPYRYLRYRYAGKHRSVYLGKGSGT